MRNTSHSSSVSDTSRATGGNPRPQQMALRYDERYELRQGWQELLEELRLIVTVLGLKQVAYDLDQQPSALAHALAERDRHYVRAEWLPYLVAHAHTDRVVEIIAAWRGLDVEPAEQLTPEEQLRRLDAVLDSMPELGEVIRKKAGI